MGPSICVERPLTRGVLPATFALSQPEHAFMTDTHNQNENGAAERTGATLLFFMLILMGFFIGFVCATITLDNFYKEKCPDTPVQSRIVQ